MELVEGQSLAAWLARPRSVAERLAAFEQAGAGLAAAHRDGLVHRDFKPDNVLVDPATFPAPGSVKVTDFGLARTLGDSTSVDGAVGTPAYMAPEQRRRHRASPASDQFAFCLALCRALDTALPAWLDDEAYPAPVGCETTHPALRRVLHRGLRLDPRARYPSMDALLTALRRASKPQKARRASIVAVAAGFATLTAAALATTTPAAAPIADPRAPSDSAEPDAALVVADALGALGRGRRGRRPDCDGAGSLCGRVGTRRASRVRLGGHAGLPRRLHGARRRGGRHPLARGGGAPGPTRHSNGPGFSTSRLPRPSKTHATTTHARGSPLRWRSTPRPPTPLPATSSTRGSGWESPSCTRDDRSKHATPSPTR